MGLCFERGFKNEVKVSLKSQVNADVDFVLLFMNCTERQAEADPGTSWVDSGREGEEEQRGQREVCAVRGSYHCSQA